ncbi:BON domain-containing protein [Massilia glaciei]|uniref:BON domain-containing protein n=1 Tax=Massilia glaciei TaxID=1524097 RepID=A0A2U2HPG7_9BURK|nr:BON domain-containing protein [Massilia glaciei]PWF49410.1 BON domain-containing protein [Massilia glaciei]
MKNIVATMLAMAAGASFAAAPTAALNHDPATYRNITQKVEADYKAAVSTCAGAVGNAREVCLEEAKVARVRSEADALAQYNNTAKGREKARRKVADAQYTLAKVRCAGMSAADQQGCMSRARAEHTAAIADARAGRNTLAANETAREAMLRRCAQQTGRKDAACLLENGTVAGGNVADRAENAAETVADKTADTARGALQATRSAAETAAERTRDAASTVAQKTARAADTVVAKTRDAAANVAQRTERAAATAVPKADRATDDLADTGDKVATRTGKVVADAVITTKVKANIIKQLDVGGLAIHVKTEKGTVMLSGFVDSKTEADTAVQLARTVEGVNNVRSAIVVK